MTISEFLHFLDQWHLHARGSCCVSDGHGIVEFDTPKEVACAAHLLDTGEVELLVSPGWADPALIGAAAEELGDEWTGEGDPAADVPLIDWCADEGDWTVSARVCDGLATIRRVIAAPSSTLQWQEELERLDAVYAQWEDRLLDEPHASRIPVELLMNDLLRI